MLIFSNDKYINVLTIMDEDGRFRRCASNRHNNTILFDRKKTFENLSEE